MSLPVVMHLSASREDHGGIQSTLAFHHARDGDLGFLPRFLSFFDHVATWSGDCVSLGSHGAMTVGYVRRRFAQEIAVRSGAITIYHDGWGVDWFAPIDGAARRIVYLHTERPYSDDLIRTYGPLVDGFMSVSQSYADRVRRILPEFPRERICVMPFFIEPPEWIGALTQSVPYSGPLRLGYAGRIEAEHKRLDRLPALLANLDRTKLDYRFEILGDGSYLTTLRRRLAGNSKVVFCGWLQGENYWRAVSGWDAIVLLSDYEGFSRVTMEAMCCGVLPVHPAFSPAAVELLGPACEAGLYPVGDIAAATDRIAGLAALGAAGRKTLGRKCVAHLSAHTPSNYIAAYREFVMRVFNMPPIAQHLPPPRWHDWVPLGVYTRVFPRRF